MVIKKAHFRIFFPPFNFMLAANTVTPETVVYEGKDVKDQDSSSIALFIPLCENRHKVSHGREQIHLEKHPG